MLDVIKVDACLVYLGVLERPAAELYRCKSAAVGKRFAKAAPQIKTTNKKHPQNDLFRRCVITYRIRI